MTCEVYYTDHFEAAHRLDAFPEGHKCRRMHGHRYKVTITVKGPVREDTGIVLDYHDIAVAWSRLKARLDHQILNEVMDSHTTAEYLAKWIWDRMAIDHLHSVRVDETGHSGVIYRGDD